MPRHFGILEEIQAQQISLYVIRVGKRDGLIFIPFLFRKRAYIEPMKKLCFSMIFRAVKTTAEFEADTAVEILMSALLYGGFLEYHQEYHKNEILNDFSRYFEAKLKKPMV